MFSKLSLTFYKSYLNVTTSILQAVFSHKHEKIFLEQHSLNVFMMLFVAFLNILSNIFCNFYKKYFNNTKKTK